MLNTGFDTVRHTFSVAAPFVEYDVVIASERARNRRISTLKCAFMLVQCVQIVVAGSEIWSFLRFLE